MADIWLIAGLGNPGPKYERTRHNAGFWFLDELALRAGASLRGQPRLLADVDRVSLAGTACILCRPATYMNESGQAVRAVMDYYQVDRTRLMVAHDELDLPPGAARLKRGGGHGGHNGLRSLFAHLGGPDFVRLRLGIGHPGHRDAVTPWVLSRAPAVEEQAVRDAVARAVDVMPDVVGGGLEAAMRRLHTAGTAAE